MASAADTTTTTTRACGLDGARPAGFSFLWPWCALAAVVYGSLLPFGFDTHACALVSGVGISQVRFAQTTGPDIVVNLLLYAPIACLLSMRSLNRKKSRLHTALMPIAIAATTSLAVELLQTGVAERVASWWDVLLNTAGAVIGVGLAHLWHRHRLDWYERLRANPWRAAAISLFAGLFVYHLAPFDFVTSTQALHASFHRAHVEWTPGLVDGTRNGAALARAMAAAAWFGLAAWLYAKMRLRRGTEPAIAMLSAIRHGVVLVTMIEILQLFTGSHVFELADITTRSAACILGGAAAAIFADNPWSTGRDVAARTTARFVGLALALAVQVALMLAVVQLNHPTVASHVTQRAGVLPFESLWRAPACLALANVTGIALAYGLLAATVWALLAYVDRRSAGPVVCLTVAGFALFLAVAHALSSQHLLDITEPVIATFAAFAAVQICQAIRRPALQSSDR